MCFAAVVPTISAAPRGNMEEVLSAFISQYAKERTEWKRDIQFIADPSAIPPGWQLGMSRAGYYIFRPKTYGELTDSEKQDVCRDPRLKAWLISSRSGRRYPTLGAEEPASGPGFFPMEGGDGVEAKESETRSFTVTIDAIEALRPRAVSLELTDSMPK